MATDADAQLKKKAEIPLIQGTDQMLNIQYKEMWSVRGTRSLRANR